MEWRASNFTVDFLSALGHTQRFERFFILPMTSVNSASSRVGRLIGFFASGKK